jgi:GT2 family glycosyltransferase
VRVQVIGNARNLGFPAACNQGLRIAEGQYLVLLNNDTVPAADWLDQLVGLADSGLGHGLVGPMSNYAVPPQLVEHVPYSDLAGMHRFAAQWRAEHQGKWLAVERLSSSCLLVKRAVYETIGGLDERFGLGLFDDQDLSLRARRAGFTLAVAYDAFMHHAGSKTFAGAGIDAGALSRENRETFIAKWGEEALEGCREVSLTRWADPPRQRSVKVSLIMIVRNEEANLAHCLESVRGLFDEAVIADTGSTDRTVEIAEASGAKVVHFPWVDDFSAARNAALAAATGDYVFWLDADDRVEAAELERLRHLFAGLGRDPLVAYNVYCACPPDANGEGGSTVVDHVRLFPRRPDLTFRYRVHEQILPALNEAGIPVLWSRVTVRHEGYTDPELRRRKLERDERLLNLEIQERPDDPFVQFHLAMIAACRRDWSAALEQARASLARSKAGDSIVRKLYVVIARAHENLGEPERALEVCREGVELEPDNAELVHREAVLRFHAGEEAGAKACWERIRTMFRRERFCSIDQDLYGHQTARNLAMLAERRGDRAEAVRLDRAVLAECPGDASILAALRRLQARP